MGLNGPTTLELVKVGYGIEKPSAVQQAIAQALDGAPLGRLWGNANVRRAFGDAKPYPGKPAVVLLVAASRALKTKLVAAGAMRSVMTCDTGVMTPGDEARLSLLGPDIDKAKAVYSNMLALARRCYFDDIEGDPKVQSFRMRRSQDGSTCIEVALAALAKAGGGLIARWAAGSVFTEAPRMVGEEEGKKNIDEGLTALRNRMLPGTSIVLEGSPWQPWGPVYDLDMEHFGKTNPDCLVIRAPGPLLWPERYTPEYCEKIRRQDPRAYQADVLGIYVDPEDSLFATEDIRACIHHVESFPPRVDADGNLLVEYVAAMDPATRGNAWTLVVLACIGEDERGLEVYEQALAVQWQGTPQNPLRPWDVLTEMAALCKPYGVDGAITDQASFDSLADTGDRAGFGLTGLFGNDDSREMDCEALRPLISSRRIRLVNNGQQRNDLQRVTKYVTTTGYSYQYPTSGDGRHCDFVSAIGRAKRFCPPPPTPGQGPRFDRAWTRRGLRSGGADLVRRLG